MARPRNRNSSQLYVYPANITLGWRHVRTISFGDGEAKVERGSMRRVYDQFGQHVGYQLVVAPPRTDESLRSAHSAGQISAAESVANAGLLGVSQTAGLDDDQRFERASEFSKTLYPKVDLIEDFVERAQEKVRLWTQPAPGRGDRAVRVYPKPPRA